LNRCNTMLDSDFRIHALVPPVLSKVLRLAHFVNVDKTVIICLATKDSRQNNSGEYN
jgi:hypothetical protein